MNSLLMAQTGLASLARSPIAWGLALAGLGMWVSLQGRSSRLARVGQMIGAAGLIVLAIALPKLSELANFEQWTDQITFWLLAAVAVICSASAVITRNPVYTAIWFAGSLVGVAGLFLFQHAQFLGFATIVVYAGAIVVTFLFVLMLANPEGQARYDRISWAHFPVPAMILGSVVFVLAIAVTFFQQPPAVVAGGKPVLAEEHVAHFGGELFAKHLVSVEVAGTILLVALVGAIAIVIQGKEQPGPLPSARESTVGRRSS